MIAVERVLVVLTVLAALFLMFNWLTPERIVRSGADAWREDVTP